MTRLVKITQISNIYADVLLLISDTLGIDTVKKELSDFNEVFKSSDELVKLLKNPTISNIKKFEIIDEIFKNNIHQEIINFLKQLIEKNRFNEFDGIISAFEKKSNDIRNIKNITIISAIDLNDDFKNRITEKMKTKLNSEIIANWQTDKDIIGGLVVKYDDNVIDTSVRTKLKDLSKQIK